MHEPSDADLIATIERHGTEAAFRTLYRRHSPRLYQLLLRLAGGNVAEAEDMLQETWFRAVRRLGRFRRTESLPAWLRGIAVNVARESLRRYVREAGRLTDADPDDFGAAPVERPVGDVEEAITLLPAGYRAVLVLHDVEGYRHAEIAEALGITVGTSKSQLFAARRALRHMLVGQERSEGLAHG